MNTYKERYFFHTFGRLIHLTCYLVMLQINKEKLLVKLNKNFNSFKKINGVIILYLIYFSLLLTYRSFAIVAENVEEF